MAIFAPRPYIVQYSFSGFQAVNPNKPLPAPRLDDELARIQIAISQLIIEVGGLASLEASTPLTKGALLTAVDVMLAGGISNFETWLSASPEDPYRFAYEFKQWASSLYPALLAYFQASNLAIPPGLGLSAQNAQSQLASLVTYATTQPG
jgi:hypothetical protein